MSNEVHGVFLQSLEIYLVDHGVEKLNEIKKSVNTTGYHR